MEYLKNPLLNTVNPFYHGNKFDKGRFFNDYERIHPSRMDFIKHGLSRNPQRKEKKNSSWKIDLVESRVFIETKEDVLMWLGHSSFFLRMDGISILIDPVFFNLPFYKRKVKIPYKIEDFKNIDYILVSHNHRDHMDLGTLKILVKNNPQAIILTGLKNGLTLRKIKNAKIQEAGWYQQYITDKLIKIIYTPAIHWSRRYLWDMNRALWGGFFIVSSNTSLYFAGDTKMGKHFHDIKNIFGNPDFSLFPIGTYKPEYIMSASHINPEEAYEAYKILGGKYFVPMHYGTYDLSNEPLEEPLKKIKKIFNKSSNLIAPYVGEPIFL